MLQANQQHGSEPTHSLRPWQRLSVKLACLLAAVTLCAVAAVGGLTYKRHQRELEDTVGTQLLNIVRVTPSRSTLRCTLKSSAASTLAHRPTCGSRESSSPFGTRCCCQRIGNMNALRRRWPRPWAPSP
jgi:hypothetical protein